ncbi:MAG TPA: hypothetical protein VMV89_12650 [Candidatus Paceibacterota bacterium]|nr:hypothetical protein [Candidatus Paceibacterota bacterium]
MKNFSASRSLIALVILAGCIVLAQVAIASGQDAKSQNVFTASPVLPKDLKRVLVLPLVCEESRADLSGGCEMLDPILQAELVKTKRFEVIAAGSEMLRSLTGQSGWSGAEVLPTNFFDSLQRAYGCDAVLFCQLTVFHAYAPLAVGWRMKLVDATTKKIIWAADMVFDANDPAVVKSAEQFQKLQQNVHGEMKSLLENLMRVADRQPTSALDDQWMILNSPRCFGQYSAAKLLQTLPER